MEKKRRYTLRISESLHQSLTGQAQEDSRSLHGQIIHILMENLKTKKAADLTDQSVSAASLNCYSKEKENSYE